MASYAAPLEDIAFVVNNVLNFQNVADGIPDFGGLGGDMLTTLAGEAAKLMQQQIAPLNATGDAEGCHWEQARVTTPAGFRSAYRALSDAGWIGLSNPADYGGQGLPYTLAKIVEELLCSANVGFSLFTGLTTGCFEALHANASAAVRQKYLPHLANGEWTGTMCLTEPQAGTDLAAVRTKAVPQPDGSYRLEGTKIFISCGEHDLTDNIVHFVLARVEGAPPGIRGLSTFAVPKFQVNDDGSIGPHNGVLCTGIEHKMGLHGSPTCQIQFDGAVGDMVGEPGSGIRNMFVMMNRARIMVGGQGLSQCELATQNAIRYARERIQSAAIGGSAGSVPIIEHADVRRMLLHMKAVTEGARVLHYETAMYVDQAQSHPDPAVRELAQDWVDLNTPLVKSFCTDAGFELASLAIQVYGGHGYVRDNGIEQIVRDSRVLAIYEGTNGVQALDLVRRKLLMHDGRLPRQFFERVGAELGDEAALQFLSQPLQQALQVLQQTTEWMQQSLKELPDDAAFGAVDYQRAFALTYLGYNWLRSARAALALADGPMRQAKLATAAYFAAHLLPQVATLCDTARAGAGSLMTLPAEAF